MGLASSVPDAPGGPSTPATVSFSGRGRWVGQPPAALSAVPLSRHRAVRELSVPLRTSAEAGWRGSLASGVPPAAGGLPLPAAVSCSRRGRWLGQPRAALSVVPPSRHRAGPRAAHPVADSWSWTTSASFLPRWSHHHPAHRTPSAAIAAKPTPHSITRWPGSANVYSAGNITSCFGLVYMKWRRTGSNRQPPACKAGALPIELRPQKRKSEVRKPKFAKTVCNGDHQQLGLEFRVSHFGFPSQWAHEESDLGPRRYQRRALTN